MRRLPAPADSVEDVYETCISTYRDKGFKERLASALPTAIAASNDFESKAARAETYTIPVEESVGGILSSSEMRSIYNDKFAKQGSPGRNYYDRYMAAPPQGICPLCGVRIVSTLDHYLPKSKYPSLAVTPKNLIPSCYDCNLGKKAFVPNSSETIPLHPYFDDVEQVRWLYVRLTIEGNHLIPSYCISRPDDWNESFLRRVQNHMNLYKLPSLYAVQAEQEIVSCRQRWHRIYKSCGQSVLEQLFVDDCEGREAICLNSWQSALYRSIIEQMDILCTWLDLES